MKDTNHLHTVLLKILICSGFLILPVTSLMAQKLPGEDRLKMLMDSVENLKLVRQFDSAILLCNKVDKESLAISDWESQARAFNELSDIYRGLREYDSAKNFSRKAQDVICQHNLNNTVEYPRNIFYAAKIINYEHFRDIITVKDSIQRCFSMAFQLNQDLKLPNKNFTAELLFGIGYFHQVLGNISEANHYYNELISLLDSHFEETDYRRGLYLYYISIYYYNTGDYERSNILAQIASYILSQDKIDFNRYLSCEVQIGNNYWELKRFQEAAEQYEKIINLMESEKGRKNSILIEPYINICQALITLADYDGAIKYANKAIDIINVNPKWMRHTYFIYNDLAEVYEQKGDLKRAELYFKKSLDQRLALFGINHEEVFEGFRFFGEYYERKGDYVQALENYQKSMGAIYKDFNPKNKYDNPIFEGYTNTEQLLFVLFDKAGTLFKLYNQSNDIRDLESAYALYLKIYQLLEELLNSGYIDKSSIQLFNRFDEGFKISIDCAVKLNEITSDDQYLDQSFKFIEQNKYFLLRKALVNSNHNEDENDAFPGKAEKTFSMEVGRLTRSVTLEKNPESLFQIRNQLLRIVNERDRLNEGKQHVNAVSLGTEANKMTISDAMHLVKNEKELLIEYHWSNDHVYAFVIGKDFADIIKIESSAKLLSSIGLYAATLTNHNPQTSDFNDYTEAAYYLYLSLIKPVETQISVSPKMDEIQRLVIVPDGPLSTLPFEAFITEQDTISGSYWGLSYLCRKYIMSYAYSLNILKDNYSEVTKISDPKMLAMSYSDKSIGMSTVEKLRSENELPYSSDEIIRIKKRVKSTNYLGEDATEDVFKSTANQYSIIHLALHGQADTTDMFNSQLIFKRDTSSIEDGELRAYELYNMDLSKTDLVVLSACETGIGKQAKGEGIFSIARGFAYAGCPSIVMSLWKVNDKTTADLFDYFYANLALKISKDEALRNAKLSYIENSDDIGAHPANWAAFIALGNNQPVRIPVSNPYWIYILSIIGFISIITFFIYNRSRKNPV